MRQSIGDRTESPPTVIPESRPALPVGTADLPELRWLLRHRMMRNAGIVRRTRDMADTLGFVRDMADTLENAAMSTLDHIELLDMATVSGAVLSAALERRASAGAHFREPDPEDPAELTGLEPPGG